MTWSVPSRQRHGSDPGGVAGPSDQVEIGEGNREHPAVVVVRWGQQKFLKKMDVVCLATAASVTTMRCAIAALERPSAIKASTSCSRGLSMATALSWEDVRASNWAYHLRVHRSSSLGDPANRSC